MGFGIVISFLVMVVVCSLIRILKLIINGNIATSTLHFLNVIRIAERMISAMLLITAI